MSTVYSRTKKKKTEITAQTKKKTNRAFLFVQRQPIAKLKNRSAWIFLHREFASTVANLSSMSDLPFIRRHLLVSGFVAGAIRLANVIKEETGTEAGNERKETRICTSETKEFHWWNRACQRSFLISKATAARITGCWHECSLCRGPRWELCMIPVLPFFNLYTQA